MTFYFFLIILNLVVCSALFLTNWLRVIKMDKGTRLEVAASIIALAVFALCSAFSPFVGEWGVVLGWPQVMLTLAVLAVQLSTNRLWDKGPPRSLQTGQHRRYTDEHPRHA